jgi:hypothetical protein
MATVTLSWSANPASDNVKSYEIFGANGTSVAFGSCTLLATVSGLTWTDVGLPFNQARTYYIVAVNAVGASATPEGPINITTAGPNSAYVANEGGAPSLQEGTHASRPAAGNAGALYVETDTFWIFRDNGTSWDPIGSGTGLVSVSTTGGTTNLSVTQCEAGIVVVSGTLTSNATVNLGTGSAAAFNGRYTIVNSTTGAFTLTLQACPTSPSGSVVVAQGSAATVYTNGAAIGLATSAPFTSTQPGAVPASGGGTTNYLRADGAWAAPSGGGGSGDLGVLHVYEEEPVGTAGGSSIATTWLPRIVNTTQAGSISGAQRATSTVTISIASPGVITWNSHGLTAGSAVMFTTTGTLPTGLSVGTIYYVLSPTANTFTVATTPGGTAVNTSGSQSGTHTANTSEITLPAGTYDVMATAPVFSGSAGYSSAIRLYNVTDSAVIILGNTDWNNVANMEKRTMVMGRFTLAAQKNVAVQSYHQLSVSSNGLGVNIGQTGVNNHFTDIIFRRVS